MLAGYTQPTSGRIMIAGTDATRTPPQRRGLGMVFQSYALFPHMSVAENVGYGLKLRKVAGAERTRRVSEALDLVGLGHLAASRPKKLSGGQQQRVALARAIAIRPTLLLLDARLRVQMRAEIRRIQAETGLTVVLVTHDQDEALEMSDRMVLMREGRIMQEGAPTEVFTAPANRFVAEFLGYENFLTLPDGALATIRPEHLAIDRSGAATSAGLTLDGTVVDVAYRGVDRLVTVDTVDAQGTAVRLMADVRDEAVPARAGDRVSVSAAAARLIRLAA